MKEITNFEINKIYHITLDTDEFEDTTYQLNYDNFGKNDLIHIHLIDREQGIESNLITFFKNLIYGNMYYLNNNLGTGTIYYFRFDNNDKKFVKEWGE